MGATGAGRAARGAAKARRLAPAVALAVTCAACAGGSRDVVPESHDVVGDAGVPAPSAEGYEYVARRPLAVVALAEGRGLEGVTARAAVDRLADRLDACVTDEGRKGGAVDGAARVIAQIAEDGTVAATSARIDPGAGSASIAALCLVAPLKAMTFPSGGAGARGLAVEAIWGRVLPAK
jgi:hypothetical protein